MITQQNDNQFKLLMTKDIYDILDGDKGCGTYSFEDDKTTVSIKMPYLKGMDICNISNRFGLPAEYGSLSRWEYLDNLFHHCIKEGTCSDLLSYLFDRKQFEELFAGHSDNTANKAYIRFTETIFKEINGFLQTGRNELRIVGKKFVIGKIDSRVEVAAPQIKSIDQPYIKEMHARALDDISQGSFDSAITKSRTLLEEVFIEVITRKGERRSESGNIRELYKQVKSLYRMHADRDTDKRINELLSGLEKIVSAIAEMRNKSSDAHGVGRNRIKIDKHHAMLVVNSAATMAEFVLSVAEKANKR